MFASKTIVETLHFISFQCAAVGALVQYAAGDTTLKVSWLTRSAGRSLFAAVVVGKTIVYDHRNQHSQLVQR